MQYPARYVPPLETRDDGWPAHSKGYRLLDLVDAHWRDAAGRPVVLDEWQRWLIVSALETFPPGHKRAGQLRFKVILISIPRRCGKSLISAILGLYAMTQHSPAPKVLGLASTREQANLIYGYLYDSVRQSPILSTAIKATGTRGLRWKDGRGDYKVLSAKLEALQGYGGCVLFDEVHIAKPQMYEAMLYSVRSDPELFLVATTTAGDDTSETLKSMYAQVDQAIEAEDPSGVIMGGFIWEAPEGAKPGLEALKIANPAVECGRIDGEEILKADEGRHLSSVMRYTYNRFVKNSDEWLDPAAWTKCGGNANQPWPFPDLKGAWIGVDQTPDGKWASFSAARKDAETGLIHTRVLASVEYPDLAYYKQLCDAYAKRGVAGFVMDPYRLKPLVEHLQGKGRKVEKIDGPANVRAAMTVHRLISRSRVRHARDPLLKVQLTNGTKKDVRNGSDDWRIVPIPGQKTAWCDALFSMVYSVYAAENNIKKTFDMTPMESRAA